MVLATGHAGVHSHSLQTGAPQCTCKQHTAHGCCITELCCVCHRMQTTPPPGGRKQLMQALQEVVAVCTTIGSTLNRPHGVSKSAAHAHHRQLLELHPSSAQVLLQILLWTAATRIRSCMTMA